VTETVEINTPPEQVWKSIGIFRDMRWHPAIEKVEGSRPFRWETTPRTSTPTLPGGFVYFACSGTVAMSLRLLIWFVTSARLPGEADVGDGPRTFRLFLR
jgi:hypothetical protein